MTFILALLPNVTSTVIINLSIFGYIFFTNSTNTNYFFVITIILSTYFFLVLYWCIKDHFIRTCVALQRLGEHTEVVSLS